MPTYQVKCAHCFNWIIVVFPYTRPFRLAHVDVQLHKPVNILVETWTGSGEETIVKISQEIITL